jgi:hypothetical protein
MSSTISDWVDVQIVSQLDAGEVPDSLTIPRCRAGGKTTTGFISIGRAGVGHPIILRG